MADGPRLTTMVVQGIEGLMDAYDAAMADGAICQMDDALIRSQKRELYALAMDADEGVGLAVTMIRRGPESPSLKRRMVERGLRIAGREGNGPNAA